MTHKPWWETCPGRLEYELNALEGAGIEYRKDDEAFAKGIMCLNLSMDGVGKLRVVFPDLYPYFRFEIYAPDLQLPHHQNPFHKNLCMIGRRTENWRTNDTLASFLLQRLPQVLEAGTSTGREEVVGTEQEQAEPISNYYSYQPGAGIVVDSGWTINPCCQSGTLLINVSSQEAQVIQGMVLSVMDENGGVLAETDNRLLQTFREGPISARWVRLTDPPYVNTPRALFEYLFSKSPYLGHIDNNPVSDGILQIRAAIFPEETSEWRKIGQGWIFVCKFEPRNYGKKKTKKSK